MWLDLHHIKIDWSSKKLNARHAKFIILEYIGSHIYKLNIFPEIDNVFHTWLLRSAIDDLFSSQRRANWQSPTLIANDDEKKYEIEAIFNKHVVNYDQGCHHEY